MRVVVWCLLNLIAQAVSHSSSWSSSSSSVREYREIHRSLPEENELEGSRERQPGVQQGIGENNFKAKRGKRGKMIGSGDDALGDFLRKPKMKGKRNSPKFKERFSASEGSSPSPQIVPVLGTPPTNGTKPMVGSHSGRDAIFALAANYPLELFKFFVGSLRRFGFKDDIVLAVNPKKSMRPGTFQYLVETNVVGYGFEVDCRKKDDCRLQDSFFGCVCSFLREILSYSTDIRIPVLIAPLPIFVTLSMVS